MTQRSPIASSSKRVRQDASDSDNIDEEIRVRTQAMPGSLTHVVGDPTKYKAIIVPIELVPTIEKLCQELLQKLITEKNKVIDVDPDDEVFNNPPPTEETKKSFINEFGTTRRLFFNALNQTNERNLIENVAPGEFDSFKNARRILSKWYIIGSHLFNKLKGDVDTNKYLKLNFDISVAVTDNDLKEKCTAKILETKKLLEHSLTSSVLDKAFYWNQEAQILYEKTPKNIFLKAFRVVTKANKHLFNPTNPNHNENRTHNYRQRNNTYRGQYNTHNTDNTKRNPQLNTERNPYKIHNWNDRRPRFDSNKHQNNQNNIYDDEYPPPRQQYNDYRRYKRQPPSNDEEEYIPPRYHQRPRSFYGRPSRNEYYD